MCKQISAILFLAGLAAQAPDARERASQAATGLGRVLMELLGEELKRGGYAGAARACSELAQNVTEEFGRERGLEIRRVSLRARNPKDQPDEWEAAKLREWERLYKPGSPPEEVFEVVEEGGRRYARHMRPIVVQAMCLGCHGMRESMAEEVRQALDERYPRDRATGYRAGDLRGAFSVTVRLDAK
ncbi:MAG: Tll0287-like domain-containing protein [Bryobacteraceae bacterium]